MVHLCPARPPALLFCLPACLPAACLQVATQFFVLQVLTVFFASFLTGSLINQLGAFLVDTGGLLRYLDTSEYSLQVRNYLAWLSRLDHGWFFWGAFLVNTGGLLRFLGTGESAWFSWAKGGCPLLYLAGMWCAVHLFLLPA